MSAPSSPVVRVRLLTHHGDRPRSPRGAELPGAAVLPLPPRGDAAGGRAHEALLTSSVTTRASGEHLRVRLRGDVDLLLGDELALVVDEVLRHCRAHPRADVHLDVREVTALDTTGVRFVERVRRDCADLGSRCTTSAARPAVARVLELARQVADGRLAAS